LKATKVISFLESVAPPSYDYSIIGDEEGLLLGDADQRVNKVGVVWDLNPWVLKHMAADGVDLIVTHTYPFLRREVAKLEGYSCLNDLSINELKKALLRDKRIVLYRAHTSWDNASGGNNDKLAEELGLTRITKVPFGRTGVIKTTSLADFSLAVKTALGSQVVRFSGDPQREVTSVMVAAGTGFLFPELIEYCYQQGIDVLVSGDLVKKNARRALELGVALVDAGVRETELPGMKALTLRLQQAGFKAEFYDSGDYYGYV